MHEREPKKDRILTVVRRLIRLIERTGGYLSSEDQRTLHDARELEMEMEDARDLNPADQPPAETR